MRLGKRAMPIGWALVAAEAVIVARRHWGSLHPQSRRRLRELVAKSKGRPGQLTREERRELMHHVRQLDLRALVAELGDVLSPVRLPGRRKRRRR
jgi:MazG nucleotide pyrophosphohydrolase domain